MTFRVLNWHACVALSKTIETSVSSTDLRFLQPKSNMRERLFSKVGHVLNDRRCGVNHTNIESQMSLQMRADLWGPEDFTNLASASD